MTPSRKLLLELLEDRTAPATFGNPWPDAGRLSLGFVPDGTDVAGQQSQLFGLLNAVAPTQTWEGVILRAFQTWAATTNINLTLMADNGAPLGTPGPVQHDARFGDIRIAAVPMSSDVVAFALPFDFAAGRWAGTVEFNSNYTFTLGGASGYDLFSVALHESGHALSLASSSDPDSVMYDSFSGVRTGLSPADVAAIQSLYGVRPQDSTNSGVSSATALNLSNNGNGLNPVVVDSALVSASDVDFYSFKPGNNQTGLTILVQTSGISLLAPSLTVYSSSLSVLATSEALDPIHGDLTVHLSNLTVGAVYYVAVTGATGDVFSMGTYRMQIVPDGVTPASGTPATTPVLPADGHTNDTVGTATDLRNRMFQMGTAYTYALQTSLSDPSDVDYYHIRSPQGANGTSVVMTALVWGTDFDGLNPVLSVYDSQGRLLAANVLVSENESYVVQVTNALPNTDYYVLVSADESEGANSTGNYFLGVEFSGAAVALQKLTGGTLAQAGTQTLGTLEVNESQVFHWELSVSGSQAPPGTGLMMTVYDQYGNAVSSLTVMSGETKSLTTFLGPGNYTVQITSITPIGGVFTPLSYDLFGLGLSDPVGPVPTNPVSTPTSGEGSTFVAHG
jgi:hypothetical protein